MRYVHSVAVVLAVLLASQCLAVRPPSRRGPALVRAGGLSIGQVFKPSKVDLDLCKFCIDFSQQALNQLLNIILQVGVVGTCGDLCQALADKTGSQALGVACNLLCDIEGVKEFIKIIENADLDPIYYCELLKQCTIKDDGDAKITSLDVSPKSGPQGTFMIDVEYTSKNGTGTGEMVIDIDTVDGIPLGQGFILEAQEAGSYGQKISLKAEPNPECDPTQGPCEQFLPGVYNVSIAICNGECGSKHPHSQIYDQGMTNFTITG
ncbi:countin-1-like isoform X1 [Branchiostoma floridae]|uniref:Countin-1-like isoform X1 n=1 Tax=Branchiostoma floridae TaxID=7739 RepID=A0A9J7LD96_BRAFL|nr:countin-1-like isoform X1 [Branchiostoma floridae]